MPDSINAFPPLRPTRLVLGLLLAGLAHAPAWAQTVDADAAQVLAKKGGCFKCHAVEKRKKAPAYREVATKYRGKTDAEILLYKHITGEASVTTDDGDERHAPPPTQSRAELDNLIRWILSL